MHHMFTFEFIYIYIYILLGTCVSISSRMKRIYIFLSKKYLFFVRNLNSNFGFVTSFNGISSYAGYLMPKLSLKFTHS